MRFSQEMLTALAVVAVNLCGTHAVVSHSALSAPRRWISPHKGAFGLVQQVSRGGSNDTDSEEPGEAVELYLPGLLEASIPKTKKVSCVGCLCDLQFCHL
jgi:hypothetical protein